MEIEIEWLEKEKILITGLRGLVTLKDVKRWERETIDASKQIPKESKFQILFDSRNYEFDKVETHKYYRRVMPNFLTHHEFLASYIQSDERERLAKVKAWGKSYCIGLALLHHDSEKIRLFNELYGNRSERYFTDREEALNWLKRVEHHPKQEDFAR